MEVPRTVTGAAALLCLAICALSAPDYLASTTVFSVIWTTPLLIAKLSVVYVVVGRSAAAAQRGGGAAALYAHQPPRKAFIMGLKGRDESYFSKPDGNRWNTHNNREEARTV